MTEKTPQRDALFSNPLDQFASFTFDEQVVQVFPDMIKRSVPGYNQILAMIGVFAQRFVPPQGRVYDLGCSLGATTLSIARALSEKHPAELIGIDNAQAMITRCEEILAQHLPDQPVTLYCADILTEDFRPCHLMVLNFTLQFIAPADRDALLQRLYAALQPGGALIISEKFHLPDAQQNQQLIDWHHDFKRANGYSDLEISQKRSALEKVLLTDTPADLIQRLKDAGFCEALQWFQYLNFGAFIAIKEPASAVT